MSTLTLLIADDHPIFLSGLDTVVQTFQPDAQRVRCSSKDELEHRLAADDAHTYDLMLLDLHMPGFQGTEALEFVRQRMPDLPVVVVSSSEDPVVVRECIELGAFAFVPKSSSQANVVQAMRSILGGYVYLPAASMATAPTAPLPGQVAPDDMRMTARQSAVLQLTVMGLTNKGIGKRLGISDGTVKTHLAHLMERFGVHTRTELVFRLAQSGVRLDERSPSDASGLPNAFTGSSGQRR